MKRKKLLPILILMLSMLSTLSVNMTGVSALDYPAIKVVPELTTGQAPGTNFTVSIYTDYTGWDVAMYQFNLFYNPNVLQGVEVTNGDLITADEHSMHFTMGPMPDCSATFIKGPFDNTAGELSLTLGFFNAKEIATGPGTLANVTFTVVGSGASAIRIGPLTKLIGWDIFGDEEYVIVDAATDATHIQHGFFLNIPEGDVTRNVAVTNIICPAPVFKGQLVDITVDVENLGVVNEGFEVTAYYDSTVIDTETVTNLLPSATTSLTFTWDTAVVPLGTYTINATASAVPDETDTADNTLEIDVTVNEALYDPVAVITARDASDVGEEETFDGTLSWDPDGGEIISYEWDFGDGGTATGAVVTHVFEEGGIYDVQLVVTDSQYQVGVVYKTMVIEDLPPDYSARLVGWKAKPEVHHWRYSWDVDKNVTLAAYAGNNGTNPVDVTITFAILNKIGIAGPVIVEDATLDAGTKVPISVEIVPSDYGWEVGDPKLVLWGHVTLEYYDPVEDEWISTTPKIFRFSISY